MKTILIIKNSMVVKYFLFVLIFFTQSIMAMDQLVFSQETLDYRALTQEYGYKYSNLVELEALCAFLNNVEKLPYKVAVPAFTGVPSYQVHHFLKNVHNFDAEALYSTLIKDNYPANEQKKEVLRTKRLSEQFVKGSEHIASHIQEKLNFAATQYTDEESLDRIFTTANVDSFMQNSVRPQQKSLAIRSSSKEDSLLFPNAGGNKSKINVAAKTPSILKAIGEEVASSYEKKSLTQRLGSADESIFDAYPFTPVLIQIMIKEHLNGHALKCGVLFTEEMEGKIEDPERSYQSDTISIVQCAYGLNEGVVNNLISTDTFYLTDDCFYPLIRSKTYRLRGEEDGTPQFVRNDSAAAYKSALSKDALYALKKIAQALQSHYEMPMDIEFLIDEDEKTIFLVQARPLLATKNCPKASYISSNTIPSCMNISRGTTIGAVGGGIRLCKHTDEVVIEPTINDALTHYQDLGEQASLVQAALVGKEAGPTSHEATSFRSESKQVMFIPNWRDVKQWLNRSSALIISPQQNLVIEWKGKEQTTQELVEHKYIKEGWTSYPAPPFVSLNEELAPSDPLTLENIMALLPESCPQGRFQDMIASYSCSSSWKEYIEMAKKGSSDEASIALALLLVELQKAVKRYSEGVAIDQDVATRISLLERYALHYARCIKRNLCYEETSSSYNKRLLPIRFLESLLYQQPDAYEIVDGFSATTLIAKELAVEQALTRELESQNALWNGLTVQLMKIKKFALTDELERTWASFVMNLTKEGTKELQQQYTNFITGLAKSGVLPLWLHTSFAHKDSSSLDTANQLLAEFVDGKEFFVDCITKKTALDSFQKEAFARPAFFDAQWDFFNDTLLSYFVSEWFKDLFKNSKSFTQLSVLTVMASFVDIFDLAMKELQGSSEYPAQQKADCFKKMLLGSKKLLNQWVCLVPSTSSLFAGKFSLEEFLSSIDALLNQESNPALLKGTPGLNVAAFSLGSGFNRNSNVIKPRTFEDACSILHQSLLAILSALNLEAGLAKIALPPLLQTAQAMLYSLQNLPSMRSTTGAHPSLVGGRMGSNYLALLYNLPLNNHSMQCALQYEKQHKRVILSMKFFGHNDFWHDIGLFIKVASLSNILKIKDVQASKTGVEFEICIDTTTDTVYLQACLQLLLNYTHNYCGQLFSKQFEKLIKRYTGKKSDLLKTVVQEIDFVEAFKDLYTPKRWLVALVQKALQENPAIIEELPELRKKEIKWVSLTDKCLSPEQKGVMNLLESRL